MKTVKRNPEDFFGELRGKKILDIRIEDGKLVLETEEGIYAFLHKVTEEEVIMDWFSADINVCYKTIK